MVADVAASPAVRPSDPLPWPFPPPPPQLPTISNKVRYNSTLMSDYFVDFLKKKPVPTINEEYINDEGDIIVHNGGWPAARLAGRCGRAGPMLPALAPASFCARVLAC